MKPRRGIARNSERREERRKNAEQRNQEWQKLTPAQQLAELDARLGVGQGAKKQRQKIERLLQSEKEQKSKQKGGTDGRK